jgi:DNA-binding IclR family transcriptional regulator
MERERYLNTSLAKALGVLDLFNGKPNGLTLTEVARAMGSRPGSIYPIVHTLQRYGYLEREEETKRYRLGMKFLVQAHHILGSLDIREQAKPVLRELAREMGANAHLAILYEDEVLYLDREEAAPSVIIPSVIGRRVPPHCTALGKVLLAHNPGIAEQVLGKGTLPSLTPRTLTDPEVIRRELEGVLARGYGVDWEEFHEGNVCVAAPVRNYRGRVVAALSVSLAKSRLEHVPLAQLAHQVVERAQGVSRAMGYTAET